MKAGQIYFLRRHDGLVKVGFSATFQKRLVTLTKSHGPLEVLRLINGDKQRERSLHARLARHHEYGEWFRDSDELRAAMAEIPEGKLVDVAATDLDREWIEGEAALAAEAVSLANRLVHLRRQRTGLNYDNAMRSVCIDYRLRYWTVENMRRKGANSVSAFTLKNLRAALVSEMEAAKTELENIIAEEREAADLVARVQAKKAALKIRRK